MSLEEQAIEILDESASDADSNLVDKLVEEFPTLAGSLVKTINKRNNTSLEIPKKQRISKNKILLDITSTLSKINGELIIVNSRIQAQNDLLRANLGFTANSIGNLEYNDSLLTGKLDSVLQALQLQNEFMREKEEDQERDSIEGGGEATDPGAFSEGYSKGYKKGSPIKELLLEKVRNYLTTRILKFFTKKGMLNILTSVKSKLGWKTAAKGWDHIALNPKQNRFMKPRWWQAIDDYMKPITKPLTSKIDDIASSRWGKGLIQMVTDPGKWMQNIMGDKWMDKLPLGGLQKKLAKRLPLITARFSSKMVPMFGSAVSVAEANERRKEGDNFGAWLAGIGGTADAASVFTSPATATGAGAVVPGALQAVSMGADISLLVYDIWNAFTQPLQPHEMEHGGVIQAPPILTPAEKGAVIGGNGPSDIGHIVNAAAMITDTFGVNLSDTSKLRNQYSTDGSTGVVTLTPLAGSQLVREDDAKSEDLQLENVDFTSDNNISEISKEPIDYHETKGDVLFSSNNIKIDSIDGVDVASNSNVSISSITPVTETNDISNNISYDVDPVGKTKIIFVTKTNTVFGGNNVISTGGGNTYNVKVYKGHHKLSRLILAS
tara:strand:+ start:51 stop:1871 length:1821 start_codon:yes stop_codon:yes gene_type:complete